MIKSVIAASAAVAFAPAAALAGPYVNVESNSGFTGGDYSSTLLETHLGYESTLSDKTSWYIQGGPAIDFPDDAGSTTELSGKVGLGVQATERLSVYGEVAAATTNEMEFDNLAANVKAGVKYSF
jgi:outer membrane autotransporter protein